MATFRKVHTSFWSDPFTQELTPEQKYFYLYLITNEKTRQCGIYEITKRQICYDTGYNIDTVSKLLGYFIKKEKIRYNEDTNEIAVKNWAKYNNSTSPKVQICINQELTFIKDRVLIEYLYSTYTQSQEEENKNKNKIQEREKESPEKYYRIEDCLNIALADSRFAKANKTSEAELMLFNNYLEKLGRYEFNPLDYKQYFAKLKGKYPGMLKKDYTIEELKIMAIEFDKQNKL